MAIREVTVIQPTINRLPKNICGMANKKRVAAYARVSTDNVEQLTSYEAQVDYYTRTIQNNPEWEFIEVYADEGISATSTKKRVAFKRMIEDALDGKIDLILTKSVSRFARNTVDTLTHVRKLKEKGVEVYFEKENIYTLDSKGELLITIMSSIAQEESRSISENTTWGQRKRFADGKVMIPYKHFLGYDRGPDDKPIINEEQARVVRKIYKSFLEGQTPTSIAKWLTTEGIQTPSGKVRWHSCVVQSILTNEKYKGDALLQKRFTVDFLTKKQKTNEGEIPQYYVENNHPAIVTAEMFDLVQSEMLKRKAGGYTTTSMYALSNHIVCGDCGRFYGRKIWHSNDGKYRSVVWQCNGKYRHSNPCSTPSLRESDIHSMFLEAFNSIIDNKKQIISSFDSFIVSSTSIKGPQAACKRIDEECGEIEIRLDRLVSENARRPMDQEEYLAQYNHMAARYDELQKKRTELLSEIERRKSKHTQMKAYLKLLKKQDILITEFDDNLWTAVLDKMVVKSADEVVFHFKDGTELSWAIPKRKKKYEKKTNYTDI